MKFLANENIPRVSVLLIRDAGFDIVSVGGEFAGISDPHVISYANKEQRTIITFDGDYGELIFKHGLKVDQGVANQILLDAVLLVKKTEPANA